MELDRERAVCISTYGGYGITDGYQVPRGWRREMRDQDKAIPLATTRTSRLRDDGNVACAPDAYLFLGLWIEHMSRQYQYKGAKHYLPEFAEPARKDEVAVGEWVRFRLAGVGKPPQDAKRPFQDRYPGLRDLNPSGPAVTDSPIRSSLRACDERHTGHQQCASGMLGAAPLCTQHSVIRAAVGGFLPLSCCYLAPQVVDGNAWTNAGRAPVDGLVATYLSGRSGGLPGEGF